MTESLLNGVEAEQEEKTIDQIEEEEFNESQKEPEEKEEPTKPEGLDDSLWDDESKSVKQDDLLAAYKKEQDKALGLRRKLSEKGSVKPPKDVSEYELDESLNELLPNESETTSLIKDKALEAGLTTDQFSNFMTKLMPALNEKGLINNEAPLSEEESKAQYEEFKSSELEKLGADGPKILQTLANWGDGLVNTGAISQDELPVYQNMITDAPSIALLMKLRSLTGETHSIPVKTAVTDGLPSRAEIDQIIASPEYDNGDAKAHAKVKAYFEATT
jgi:hypothetical protein